MAVFSILKNFDNPSWAVGTNNFLSIVKSPLTYTRYGNQTMVYCNFPETIGPGHLGDTQADGTPGYCINKATITTSEALLYVSCNSSCNSPKKLAVRVYNPNSSTVTITKVNSGFNCTDTWYPQTGAYERFFTDIHMDHQISAGESVWIEEESVMANGRFEALMKYTISGGSIVMAVYLCTNTVSVSGSPKIVAQTSPNLYSGTASAFYISCNHSVSSATLFSSGNRNSVFYGIAQKKFSGNETESNPITLLQGGIASEDSDTYNNIGNYGLQYAFNTTLRNTQSTGRVKFKGYIISNPDSHCAGITSGGLAKAFFLGTNGDGPGKGYVRWNFCETAYISAGSSITLNYQYMHLGRGNAPGIIQWEAIKE